MAFRSALFFVLICCAVLQQHNAYAQTTVKSIREVQKALAANGYMAGPADGVLGKKTANSIREYQRSHGLPVTGVVDGVTIAALFGPAPATGPVEKKVTNLQPPPMAIEAPLTDRTLEKPPTFPDTNPADTPAASSYKFEVPTAIPQVSLTSQSPKTQTPNSSGKGTAMMVALGAVGVLLIVFRRRRKTRPVDEQVNVVVETAYNGVPSTLAEHHSQVPEDVAVTAAATGTGIQGVSAAVVPPDPRVLAQEGRPFFGGARQPEKRLVSTSPDSNWVSANITVSVGGITIPGGRIYVGSHLPKRGSSHENENCLINPKLGVSKTGDPTGATMGYWPSYSQISPNARRSYLEWLAGGRSDPHTYIGYVFLYLYGMERRLMLEDDAPDALDVASEVKRLICIYGSSGSFARYASELLTAFELKSATHRPDLIPDVEGNGYEVPASIKLALGLRVRDGNAIEPKLMLRFARTHPETRVRTPARRAPELLEALFVERMTTLYPDGFRVKGGRFKALKSTYRACSGSFAVEVSALGGSVPDITERAEPINTARAIFEQCSDDLGDYSRALGRSPGLKPTLSIVSKLPVSLRGHALATLSANPLQKISDLATSQQSISVRELGELLSVELGTAIGKAKLRELSQMLSAFGFGNTADPAYALRAPAADERALLFKLDHFDAGSHEPSAAYRFTQLSVMIGMVVGHADGDFDEAEKKSLVSRIETVGGLRPSERVRLKAEVSLAEMDAGRLNEWTRRLKDVPAASKNALAAELVSLAGADGAVHAAEVKTLESLFKRMGLDQQSLYGLLHESGSPQDNDELTEVIRSFDGPVGLPLPPEPMQRSRTQIDLGRLNAIRSETRVTSSVLADIFVDDSDVADLPASAVEELVDRDDVYDGLERRYGALIDDLRSQEIWSADDFDGLVRAAGLMPGAARNAINDWSMDRFDELLVEGDGPYQVNFHLLPAPPSNAISGQHSESAYA